MKGCDDCKHYCGTRFTIDHDEQGEIHETSQCSKRVLATGRCRYFQPKAPAEGPSSGTKLGNAAAMREALKRILDIEGYGAPWIEAKCIAQKALEGEQCTPPTAQERPQIEQPGNAAAMREALMDVVLLTVKAGKSLSCDVACGIIASKAKRALSAPARNADRFATAKAAHEAFCSEPCENPCGNCTVHKGEMSHDCFIAWLFATTEGGEHANV